MKKIIAISWTISVMLVVLTFARVDAQSDGGCSISGAGIIGCAGDSQRDSFGGNAMTMKSGDVRGQWTHISLESEVIFQGQVRYLACLRFPLSGPEVPKAEPNFANFGGIGKLNAEDGYYFDVRVFDHGEPGIYLDRYEIDIKNHAGVLVYHADGLITKDCHDCLEDASVPPYMSWVLDMGCISGGDVQIKKPNAGHPY